MAAAGEPTGRASEAWCKRGFHEWRAVNGGPFGHTQPDDDGCLQVCAACGVKRPATSTESSMAAAVAQLLEDLAEASRRLEEAEEAAAMWVYERERSKDRAPAWEDRLPDDPVRLRYLAEARHALARVSPEGVSFGATSERNEHG